MRLIDAEELWKKFSINPNTGERYRTRDCDNFPIDVHLESVQREIMCAPTIDAVPVVHGHIVWKRRTTGAYRYKGAQCPHCRHEVVVEIEKPIENDRVPYCSACNKRLDERFMHYCPNCGAKMDGEVKK